MNLLSKALAGAMLALAIGGAAAHEDTTKPPCTQLTVFAAKKTCTIDPGRPTTGPVEAAAR